MIIWLLAAALLLAWGANLGALVTVSTLDKWVDKVLLSVASFVLIFGGVLCIYAAG